MSYSYPQDLMHRARAVKDAIKTFQKVEDCFDDLYAFAKEYCSACRKIKAFPDEFLAAQEDALKNKRLYEIIMMAVAMLESSRQLDALNAFRKAMYSAKTKEEEYQILCVALSSLIGPWEVLRSQETCIAVEEAFYRERVLAEKAKYEERYGKDSFRTLNAFLEQRIKEIEQKRRKAEAKERKEREGAERKNREQEEQHAKEMRQWKDQREQMVKAQVAKEVQQWKNQREQMAREKGLHAESQAEWRAEEIDRRMTERERKLLQDEAKRSERERLKRIPLKEQLQVVVSNKERPQSYEIDFSKVSEEDLRLLPRPLLVRVITAFLWIKDPAWKELQKKARMVLVE